jgi:hypothetical protein
MYTEAELFLGTAHERPRKPDGIRLKFDDQGRLVIDEVLEFKSSENAFEHGLDKDQPQKSLETIGGIVNILNKLLTGEKTSTLKPVDVDLSLSKRIKRDGRLQQIQKKLQTITIHGDKITYSPDLTYHIIVPNGVKIPQFDPDYLSKKYGSIIKMKISQSHFSKKDIYMVTEKMSHSKQNRALDYEAESLSK